MAFAVIGGLIGAAILLITHATSTPKGPGGTYSDWYSPIQPLDTIASSGISFPKRCLYGRTCRGLSRIITL